MLCYLILNFKVNYLRNKHHLTFLWSKLIAIQLPLEILKMCFLDPEVLSRLKSATPTRITVAGKDLATPKDLETYKDNYENVALVGSGTFGSVYYAK